MKFKEGDVIIVDTSKDFRFGEILTIVGFERSDRGYSVYKLSGQPKEWNNSQSTDFIDSYFTLATKLHRTLL